MEEQRYTQAALCKQIGLSPVVFSRYITEHFPRRDILANIANALHTTTDYLLGSDRKYGFEQLKMIISDYRDDLSKNQKKELMSILMDECGQ